MKPISIIIILLMIISCSDTNKKLTHSKAKSILTECLKKISSEGNAEISIGDKSFNTSNYTDSIKLDFLKTLEKQGLLKVRYVNGEIDQTYNIELTEKANPYVLIKEKEDPLSVLTGIKNTKAVVKTFEYYIISEVKEIHEIPANNTATVTAILEKINPTPFFSLTNESIFNEVKFTFLFTSNGWGYCN